MKFRQTSVRATMRRSQSGEGFATMCPACLHGKHKDCIHEEEYICCCICNEVLNVRESKLLASA